MTMHHVTRINKRTVEVVAVQGQCFIIVNPITGEHDRLFVRSRKVVYRNKGKFVAERVEI